MAILVLKSLSLGNLLETRLHLLHSPALAGLSCQCFTRSDMQQYYCSVHCLFPIICPSFWSLERTEAPLCFEKPQSPPKSSSCSPSQLETQHACLKKQNNSFFPPATAVSETAWPVQQEMDSGGSAVSTFPKEKGLTGGSSWGKEPLGVLGTPPCFGPFLWQAAALLLPSVHPQAFKFHESSLVLEKIIIREKKRKSRGKKSSLIAEALMAGTLLPC